MNKNNLSAFAFLLAFLFIIVAAAAVLFAANDDDGDRSVRVIRDARGREVAVPAQVDKVVCLSAGSLRVISYLGAADKVVGIDSMDSGAKGARSNYAFATYRCAYDFSGISDVGSEENQKAIMDTGAQVIFTSKEDTAVLDTLQEQTGIPVVAVNAAGNITVRDEAFRENLRIAADILGREKRAAELIDGIDDMIAELEELSKKADRREKCYIGGMFYMMTGNLDMTTGNYLPFELAAAENAMPDKNRGNPYTADIKDIADCGADYMFVDCMTNGAAKQMFDERRDVLGALPAVRGGKIYSLSAYKHYGTNWESELCNAYYIGSVLHPEIFGDDAESKVNAVLELFYPGCGLDAETLSEKQAPGLTKLNW